MLRSHASHSEAATEERLPLSVAFCETAMLISRRVVESRSICILILAIAPVLGAKEPRADPGNRRRVRRIDRLQIIQLSRRRRSETQPVFHLEPEGFSHQGVCGSAQCALGTDRGRPRDHRRPVAAFPAATTSARCTVCHSPFQSVAANRLAPTAHPDEGVSCETCHGAAGGWLRGHTRTDWTYNTRVAAGMRDLRSLYVRATACAAATKVWSRNF